MKLLPPPIQPRQKPVSWKVNRKTPEDYERDRVSQCAPFFQGNVILPIPGVANVLEPWIISLIVFDIKNRRFAKLKKDSFDELLRTAGISGQYFCRSFATWDVLLPTKEQAAKRAVTCISTKFLRSKPEYLGTRRIRVTVCNVPGTITGEIVTTFLNAYDRVEDISKLRAAAGTTHGDNMFRICLDREGFQGFLS